MYKPKFDLITSRGRQSHSNPMDVFVETLPAGNAFRQAAETPTNRMLKLAKFIFSSREFSYLQLKAKMKKVKCFLYK